MLFNKRPRLVERLLLVEDEPLVAFDNEHGLKDAGYEVVATVDRAADAIAVLDAEPLDLVLSDIRLTGERTGVDVAAYARSKGVPVLFVTAHPPADAADHALGVLAKPYTERTLRAALEAVDRHLAGERPGRASGLTLFARTPG